MQLCAVGTGWLKVANMQRRMTVARISVIGNALNRVFWNHDCRKPVRPYGFTNLTSLMNFSHRKAVPADLPVLRELMAQAITKLVGNFLDSAGVQASFEIMGVDTSLVEDGTYFVIELDGRIVGCGGWSRRATLYGGDHSRGRDARLLDPLSEAARVRAMYTHPDFARRGIGRLILGLCEVAAKAEGFSSLELMATIAGEPLYSAYGYVVTERLQIPTSSGVILPGARMTKSIS